MKKFIFSVMLFLLFSSCVKKDDLNSLVMPPNFSEVPNLDNPEPTSNKDREENVAKLKELLLKSD